MANYTGTLQDELGNTYYPISEQQLQTGDKLSYTKTIQVGGDANTYYPVVITPVGRSVNDYSYKKFSISRYYASPAPDTWNTSTHRGGLTFSFYWTCDSSWGGNDHSIKVLEFHQNYANMVADWRVTNKGTMIVWLRGGNAEYMVGSEAVRFSVSVVLGDYADNTTTFSPMTSTQSYSRTPNNSYVTLAQVYPVGSIYLSTTNNNPQNFLPGTTWEQIQDKFLLTAGGTYSAGTTGGAASHTHTTGNFTLGETHIPGHRHSMTGSTIANGQNAYNAWRSVRSGDATAADYPNSTTWTNWTGGNSAHNHGSTGSTSNMPPYLVVYAWKRTA